MKSARATKLEFYAVTTALFLAALTVICAATGHWGTGRTSRAAGWPAVRQGTSGLR